MSDDMEQGLKDLLLLEKHLTKFYVKKGEDSKTAKKLAQLTIQNESNLFGYRGISWQVGKEDLEFFCLYFLDKIFCAEGTAEIAQIHKEIWSDINNIILGDNIDQKGYILPRGTGKSTFGTLSASCWCACYGHKKMIVICSATERLAKKFLNQIKECIQGNKKIEQAFGIMIDLKNRKYKVNDEVIQLTNDAQIEAYSSESPLQGIKNEKLNLRPDLMVLDDYQNRKIDVYTELGRENKWDRYCSDLKYCKQRTLYNSKGKVVKKGTVILAFGTVQHLEDFYMRLYNSVSWSFRKEKGVLVNDVDKLFNSPKWKEFKAILSDDTLASDEERLFKARQFFYDNKSEMDYPVLWEAFWDKVELAKDYYDNPSKFKQEVQSDLTSIGDDWVTTLITRKRVDIEEKKFAKTAMSVDQATGSKNSNDYTAITIGSKYNDFYYIRKGILKKFDAITEFDIYIDTLVEYLKHYKDITDVFLEKNVFKGIDGARLEKRIEEDKELKKRRIKVHLIFNTKNKDERISTIVPKINNGQVIFADEDEEYWKQVKAFRGQDYSEHDDAIDSLEMLINNIDDIEIKKEGTIYTMNLQELNWM